MSLTDVVKSASIGIVTQPARPSSSVLHAATPFTVPYTFGACTPAVESKYTAPVFAVGAVPLG
ncbi:MAG: hypothetical protein K6B45_04845 [Bacteroidaceae bacterium]|nr:hypothetical protein [Bacteroidaceae bacterium]